MTEDLSGNTVETETSESAPQYGVGPFSIREVALAGTWLVAFVVSFFPVVGPVGVGPSVWSNGIDWVLTIGVPTVAVFLIVLRRLSPQGIRRVGSLGIDQFASVAFAVATVLWLTMIWNSFITLANQRVFAATWVVWVEFFLMLAGVLLTTFAPFIAPFAQDFLDRAEVVAHRNARPVRPVSPRPAPEPAAPAAPDGDAASVSAQDARTGATAAPDETVIGDPAPEATAAGYADEVVPVESADTDPDDQHTAVLDLDAVEEDTAASEPEHAGQSSEPVDSPAVTAEPAASSVPRQPAFWALAPEERDVVDEIGIPVFRIGPTAWALVIEDRGEVFVVRHEDGRIGYLHDVTGVTRG